MNLKLHSGPNWARSWFGSPGAAGGLALVYRGPATLPGCAEAVAALLEASKWQLTVAYVGPKEKRELNEKTLAEATLYAQPGGGELEPAYKQLRGHRKQIRRFVRSGGRYLGFCLGGYLAGETPGFGLLPGDTDQYIATRGATIDHERDAMVRLRWGWRSPTVYFQDGPHFLLNSRARARVLARYPNRTIAALVTDFGDGVVGVVGPHPEAGPDWYTGARLTRRGDQLARRGHQLGQHFVDAVMTR